MLKNEKALVFVQAERNQGTSNKTGNSYDIGTLEVSDGIASIELPCEPNLASHAQSSFSRGQAINIVVDVKKRFGRSAFEVINVMAVSK